MIDIEIPKNLLTNEEEFYPDHINELWNHRIRGDEEFIDEGYFELTHTNSYGTTYPVCSKDKILLIKGEEGSHKSFVASCIQSSNFIDDRRYTLGFNMTFPPDEAIVCFDTEMDPREIKKRKKMFNDMTGLNSNDDRHQIYSLVDFSYKQRIEMITHAIQHNPYKVGVIVLDQLADLMPGYDVNDVQHSGQIIEYLLAWKRATEALIIVIMHTNRGGEKTNGILGKNVDHKAAGSFLVRYNKLEQLTEISQDKGRGRKIEIIKFTRDEIGYPKLIY